MQWFCMKQIGVGESNNLKSLDIWYKLGSPDLSSMKQGDQLPAAWGSQKELFTSFLQTWSEVYCFPGSKSSQLHI